MKYSAVLLATAASLVAAQSPADFFPECALTCLNDAVTSATDCSTTDGECRCKEENLSAIQTAATACVIESCGAEVAVSEVLPAAPLYCAAVAAGGESEETEVEPTVEETSTVEETVAETTVEETVAETTVETSSVMETVASTTIMASTTGAGNGTTVPTVTPPVEVNAAGSVGPVGSLVAFVLAALAAF